MPDLMDRLIRERRAARPAEQRPEPSDLLAALRASRSREQTPKPKPEPADPDRWVDQPLTPPDYDSQRANEFQLPSTAPQHVRDDYRMRSMGFGARPKTVEDINRDIQQARIEQGEAASLAERDRRRQLRTKPQTPEAAALMENPRKLRDTMNELGIKGTLAFGANAIIARQQGPAPAMAPMRAIPKQEAGEAFGQGLQEGLLGMAPDVGGRLGQMRADELSERPGEGTAGFLGNVTGSVIPSLVPVGGQLAKAGAFTRAASRAIPMAYGLSAADNSLASSEDMDLNTPQTVTRALGHFGFEAVSEFLGTKFELAAVNRFVDDIGEALVRGETGRAADVTRAALASMGHQGNVEGLEEVFATAGQILTDAATGAGGDPLQPRTWLDALERIATEAPKSYAGGFVAGGALGGGLTTAGAMSQAATGRTNQQIKAKIEAEMEDMQNAAIAADRMSPDFAQMAASGFQRQGPMQAAQTSEEQRRIDAELGGLARADQRRKDKANRQAQQAQQAQQEQQQERAEAERAARLSEETERLTADEWYDRAYALGRTGAEFGEFPAGDEAKTAAYERGYAAGVRDFDTGLPLTFNETVKYAMGQAREAARVRGSDKGADARKIAQRATKLSRDEVISIGEAIQQVANRMLGDPAQQRPGGAARVMGAAGGTVPGATFSTGGRDAGTGDRVSGSGGPVRESVDGGTGLGGVRATGDRPDVAGASGVRDARTGGDVSRETGQRSEPGRGARADAGGVEQTTSGQFALPGMEREARAEERIDELGGALARRFPEMNETEWANAVRRGVRWALDAYRQDVERYGEVDEDVIVADSLTMAIPQGVTISEDARQAIRDRIREYVNRYSDISNARARRERDAAEAGLEKSAENPQPSKAAQRPSKADPEKSTPPRADEDPTRRSQGQGAIGESVRGHLLYEDDNGVRFYFDSGVKITEPVPVVPGAGFVPPDPDRRTDDFRLKSEVNRDETGRSGTEPDEPVVRLGRILRERLDRGEPLPKPFVFNAAGEVFGGTVASGAFGPTEVYDALEYAFTDHIGRHPEKYRPFGDATAATEAATALDAMLKSIPTQTQRDAEKIEFQQFSTPPHYSFAAAWVANIGQNDVVLEPSAGFGSLAVHAKNAGPEAVYVNELADRRVAGLRALGFDGVFTEDAQYIGSTLAGKVRPTVVVMNPPFSRTAGRTQTRDTMTGARHIEAALDLLAPGGRLVAIVGRGMSPEHKTFRGWWRKIGEQYHIRANVGVDGGVYKKYGTSFDTRILVIDKPTGNEMRVTSTMSAGAAAAAIEPGTIVQTADGTQGVVVERRLSEGRLRVAPFGAEDAGTLVDASSVQVAGQGVPLTGEVDSIEDLLGRLEQIRDTRRPAPQQATREPGDQEGNGPEQRQQPVSGGRSASGGAGARNNAGAMGSSGRNRTRGAAGNVGSGDGSGGRVGGVGGRRGVSERGGTVEDGTGADDRGDRGGVRGDDGGADVKTEQVETQKVTADKEIKVSDDGIYARYEPSKVRVKGAKPHPSPLVESASMAAVDPPDPTYVPVIPQKTIESGMPSMEQLEAVIYAGQAHQQKLPNGERRGFFIGDGTGVGKGLEVSSIILDNWNQGRKKALWLTKTQKLSDSAQRDVSDVGLPGNSVFNINKKRPGESHDRETGVMFSTYSTIAKKPDKATAEQMASYLKRARDLGVENPEHLANFPRVIQILEWAGKDFDGVIVMDEAHLLGNAVAMKGKRGTVKPSEQALTGVLLQKLLPNARVVYASATGATESRNLAFASRLGLWGEGTAFSDVREFIGQMNEGGTSALEIVARDMKAMGVYVARSLAFQDPEGRPEMSVEYDSVVVPIEGESVETYDEIARAWSIILNNLQSVMERIAGETQADGSVRVDGKQMGQARGAFYGAQQRFFEQLILSLKAPAMIREAKRDLAEGRAPVFQLVNTGEAQAKKALDNASEDDEIGDLDFSPRQIVVQYLENAFPVHKKRKVEDEDGNVSWELVTNANGEPVLDPDAVRKRDEMIANINALPGLESVLDQIVDAFGPDGVAEITKRKKRRISGKWTDSGKAELRDHGGHGFNRDMKAFQQGQKNALVFSGAGNTGESFHASPKYGNADRRRVHYIVQNGWSASSTIQGIGRTHRSNQQTAPIVRLVVSDLNGEKRFLSTIARRLDQLGALTRGDRKTGGQGLFRPEDNLESTEAERGFVNLIDAVIRGEVPKVTVEMLEESMGLTIFNKDGRTQYPQMSQFLNRVLALPVKRQNDVFEALTAFIETQVELSIQRGELDLGVEDITADRFEMDSKETMWTDPLTGSETQLVNIDAFSKTEKKPFSWATRKAKEGGGFYVNVQSGRVWVAGSVQMRGDVQTGQLAKKRLLIGPASNAGWKTPDELADDKRFRKVDKSEAEELWAQHMDAAPDETRTGYHLITGMILPIWDRLPGAPRVRRVRVSPTETYLGRLVPQKSLGDMRKRMGMDAKLPGWVSNPDERFGKVRDEGWNLELDNGWTVEARRVEGAWSVQLFGVRPGGQMNEVERKGVKTSIVSGKYRMIVPSASVLDEIVKLHAIADAQATRRGGNSIDAAPAPDGPTFTVSHTTAEIAGLPASLVKPSNRQRPMTYDRTIPGPEGEVAARIEDVQRALERASGAPIRFRRGFFRQRKSLGWYDSFRDTIRVSRWGDLATYWHEAGHAIHKRYFNYGEDFPPNVRAELQAMGEALYGDRTPVGGYVREGFAEFIALRYGLGEDVAPQTTRWFEQWAFSRPTLWNPLMEASAAMTRFRGQGSLARVKSQIRESQTGPLARIKSAWDIIHRQFILGDAWNDQSALERALRDARKQNRAAGRDVPEARDPSSPDMLRAALRGTAPGVARQFLSVAFTDASGDPTGESLADVIKRIKKRDRADFSAFLYAVRTEMLADRGINTGISVADAREVIVAFKGRPEFIEAAKAINIYGDRVLQYLRDAGGLSMETYQAIRAAHPFYIPLQREFDPNDYLGGTGGRPRRGSANQSSGVKRLKGSDRAIVDPIEALGLQTLRFVQLAHKLRVAGALADYAEGNEGMGRIAQKVEQDRRPVRFSTAQVKSQLSELGLWNENAAEDNPKLLSEMLTVFENLPRYFGNDNIVVLTRNGKNEWWELHPDVYRTITEMDEASLHPFVWAALGIPTNLLRLGATGLNISFAAVNVVRDVPTAMHNTRIQGKRRAIPGYHLAHGMLLWLMRHPDAKKWKALGGPLSTLMGQDREAARSLLDKSVGLRSRSRAHRVAAAPFVVLNGLIDIARRVIGTLESWPRIAEFHAVLQQAEKKYGVGSTKAAMVALEAGKQVTTDFTRRGALSSMLNLWTPYVNAQIQGISQAARKAGGAEGLGPAIQWWTTQTIVSGMGALAWMLAKDEPYWEELEDWERYNFWHFQLGDGTWLRIPKPFELGTGATMTEGVLDYLYRNGDEQGKRALSGAVLSSIKGLVPMDLASQGPFGLAPAAIKPALEVAANYDSFRRRELVPDWTQRYRISEDQRGDWNTESAKRLGEWLNVSPIQIEHIIGGYTGGIVPKAIRASEQVLGLRENTRGAAGLPVIGRFVGRQSLMSGRTIDRLYRRRNDLRRREGSNVASRDELAEFRRINRVIDRVIGPTRDMIDEQPERAKELELRALKFAKWALGEGERP